jgi:hypothetical protein
VQCVRHFARKAVALGADSTSDFAPQTPTSPPGTLTTRNAVSRIGAPRLGAQSPSVVDSRDLDATFVSRWYLHALCVARTRILARTVLHVRIFLIRETARYGSAAPLTGGPMHVAVEPPFELGFSASLL